MDEYGIDGVNYDWEAPVNRRDVSQFTSLLQETKEALGENRPVTIAVRIALCASA